MKTSLVDRARVLLSAPGAAATLAAIVPLAATAAAKAADASTWSLGASSVQYFTNDGYGGSWSDYSSPTTTLGSSALPEGLKVFGTGSARGVAPLSDIALLLFGAGYQGSPDQLGSSNRLHITGSATFDQPFPWDSAVLSLPTTFAFGASFNGGLLQFTEVTTGFTAFDPSNNFVAGVGSSGFNTGPLEPGGYGFGFQYVDGFGGSPVISRIDWEINIAFHWSNFSSTDFLAVTIPQNSIDIRIVPSPGAAGVLGLAGLVALRRRR